MTSAQYDIVTGWKPQYELFTIRGSCPPISETSQTWQKSRKPQQAKSDFVDLHSANEPVQSLRVGLREWTGLTAEQHPP